jgi:L-threonylcarbamoyladenylate synthase
MQVLNVASLSDGDLEQILSFLRAGGVIGFPTDTAYGLGADPFNLKAVRRIFEIKGRAEEKPILLIVDSLDMVATVAHLTDSALVLAKSFWPGPLTMILPAQEAVPSLVTAGTSTVGVRWPKATFANRLLSAYKQPVTATSANRSGLPAAVTLEEMKHGLGEDVEIMVDGGDLPAREGSTIVDLSGPAARLIRQGPITWTEVSRVLESFKS